MCIYIYLYIYPYIHIYIHAREREREMFYLTTHSTHFMFGYMASNIWLRTILIVRKETGCRHICYSYRLTARVILYAPSHRQGNTYGGLCYTSRGALAGTYIHAHTHTHRPIYTFIFVCLSFCMSVCLSITLSIYVPPSMGHQVDLFILPTSD